MTRPAPPLQPIHGSYHPQDCKFLLTLIESDFVSVEEKERRIQSGEAHYSEMIHREPAPSDVYRQMFAKLCARYAPRLAREVRQLARMLVEAYGRDPRPLYLVSLVRAGTPVGALLRRALIAWEDQPSEHYSVSIIRDRGIDTVALDYLLDTVGAPADRVVFIDAWTAKGVITQELREWMKHYNRDRQSRGHAPVSTRLAVVSDIGGTADFAATFEDYAIPSGILNATVSGLVSRSVLNERIPTGAFHGCVLYDELEPLDQSRAFIDQVSSHFDCDADIAPAPAEAAATQRHSMLEALDRIQARHGIGDIHHIKPGIAEATRVMLRRVPALLIVRDPDHPDVGHLLQLAKEKQVAVEVDASLPFHACALIRVLHRQGSGRCPR